MRFSVVFVGYDTMVCSSRMATNVSDETVGRSYRASFPKNIHYRGTGGHCSNQLDLDCSDRRRKPRTMAVWYALVEEQFVYGKHCGTVWFSTQGNTLGIARFAD
jgi:hypothetical protein